MYTIAHVGFRIMPFQHVQLYESRKGWVKGWKKKDIGIMKFKKENGLRNGGELG